MAEAGQNCPCHDSDALVRVSVLHSAIVFGCLPNMEDTLEHLRAERRLHKNISDLASLQSADERIQLGPGTPK